MLAGIDSICLEESATDLNITTEITATSPTMMSKSNRFIIFLLFALFIVSFLYH